MILGITVVGDGLVVQEPSHHGDDLAHHLQGTTAIDTDLLCERIPPRADSENHSTGSEIVERGEGCGETGRVAAPTVHDTTSHLDVIGDAGERGHGHRGLTHQTTLGLPDRFEPTLFGVLREFHALANSMSVLKIDGDSL